MRLPLIDRVFADNTISLEFASVPATSTAVLKSGASASVSGRDGSWYYQPGDIIGGDDSSDIMRGRGKYEILRRMRTDPAVRSLEWMVKLPIRSGKWWLDAASEDPVDLMVAEFVSWQFGMDEKTALGRLSQPWKDSVNQALLCLPYGAMGEELIWADPEEWFDADGDPHYVRPLSRLAPRMASTISAFSVNAKTGDLDWIEQDLPDASRIPGDKLAWYSIDGEGGDIWGTSFLRAAYGPWKLKRALQIAAAIGWDRHAAGTPLVRYPPGGTGNRARAENIGRNWRSHERAWIAFEGPKEAGWDVEVIGGSASLADPTPILSWYDHQIAMSGLQQFSSLGNTQTGSRAVGEVLVAPYYMAVTAIAEQFAATRMKHVIRRLVDLNFGTDIEIPELRIDDLAVEDIDQLARSISDLSTAGLTFTDADTVNDIRRRIKLRELPEELAATLDALPDNVGVTPANPQEGQSIVQAA